MLDLEQTGEVSSACRKQWDLLIFDPGMGRKRLVAVADADHER
jgi:hypothetical protein